MHPDLFSDTEQRDELAVAKPVFEHHLDTLTSRNEEATFEHFCRALAEKTICPNLRAQSGPMGGGDGKVDSDSYPVADAISERWWVGSPRADEEWAFAFSAMRNWQEKLKSDVAKIAATGRGYTHVYFITNQPAKASTRAKLEELLSRDYGLKVKVLDRAWLVQQVYDNGMFDLAVSKLNIAGVVIETTKAGPRDAARREELEALDRRIQDPAQYAGAKYSLVEDIVESALLARGLGRSRHEIEGRFEHAKRIAEGVNDPSQLQRVAYNRAWTTYWWFEDFGEFNKLYAEVEACALGSADANRLEKLTTLWQLVSNSVGFGHLKAEDAQLDIRTSRLRTALEAATQNNGRPNNALQAETSLCMVSMGEAFRARDLGALDEVWRKLEDIANRSRTMGAFPIEQLFQIADRIGASFDSEAFDSLAETLIEMMRIRRSDGEAGLAYIRRGGQKLDHDKPYDAIRMFGRAEELLVKEEYQAELTLALAGAADAYHQTGLSWAARNKELASAERSLAVFQKDGKFTRSALHRLRRLAWFELTLGRLPHLLAVLRLVGGIAPQLLLPQDEQTDLDEELGMLDAALGVLLMRVPLADLPNLGKLPDTLERLGLWKSHMALLHALGQDKRLRSEGIFPEEETEATLNDLFVRWRSQPVSTQITKLPLIFAGHASAFRSVILGCEIVIQVPPQMTAMAVAESLLGGLEAFLATSDENDVSPHRETFSIEMEEGPSGLRVPEMRFDDDRGVSTLVYPPTIEFSDAQQFQEFHDWLFNAIVDVMIRIVRARDMGAWLERVAGEERGFARAVLLGNIVSIGGNVFGSTPPFMLSDWIAEDAEDYPLLRTEPWPDEQPAKPIGPLKPGKGPPPEDLVDYSRLRHSDRKVVSPIDMPLWDKARWSGVGHAKIGSVDSPPIVLILFQDRDAAEKIFEGWQERYGREERDEALRIVFVTELHASKPASYGMTISANPDLILDDGAKTFASVMRMHRMYPDSSKNLDGFKAEFARTGIYLLAPGVVESGSVTPLLHLGIVKRAIDIKPAWSLDENDMDSMILDHEDPPAIPEGVEDAPVLAALERLRELRSRER